MSFPRSSGSRTAPGFASLSCLLALVALLIAAGPARAATVSISVAADPVEDRSVSVTVGGSTESARYLFGYVTRAGSCASRYADRAVGDALLWYGGGRYISSGPYAEGSAFTPPAAGVYRVCAYLASSEGASPTASGQATFSARRSVATATIALGADPVESRYTPVTISGTTEVARYLYGYVTTSAGCAARYADRSPGDPQLWYGSGRYIEAGAFTESSAFSPPDPGIYRVCVYVADAESSVPDGTGTATLIARPNAATIDIAFGDERVDRRIVTLTISGSTEVPRYLYAYSTDGDACAASFSARPVASNPLTNDQGRYIEGAFSEKMAFSPNAAGTYRVCAYIAKSASSAPSGQREATVAIRNMNATVSFTGDMSPYLREQTRNFTVQGTLEEEAQLAVGVVSTTTCPSFDRTEFQAGDKVPAGPYSEVYRLTMPSTPEATLCAAVRNSAGRVVSTAQVRLSLLPLVTPVATFGAASGWLEGRRPVFSWATAASSTDELLLSDRQGNVLALVAADGTWVPTTDAQSDVDNADDYYDDDDSSDTSKRPGYEPAEEDADLIVKDGVARAQFQQPLWPGSYQWSVVRRLPDGRATESDPVRFRIKGPPVNGLKVRTRSYRIRSSRTPGYSKLIVKTNAYAYLRLSLRRGGREQVRNFRWGPQTEGSITFDWTCKYGGGRYRFTLTASDDDGNEYTRRGSIRTISRAQCQRLRRAERRARDRRAASRLRRQRAAVRRDLQRRIQNCRNVGGTPRRWTWQDGSSSLICVLPYGWYYI